MLQVALIGTYYEFIIVMFDGSFKKLLFFIIFYLFSISGTPPTPVLFAHAISSATHYWMCDLGQIT